MSIYGLWASERAIIAVGVAGPFLCGPPLQCPRTALGRRTLLGEFASARPIEIAATDALLHADPELADLAFELGVIVHELPQTLVDAVVCAAGLQAARRCAELVARLSTQPGMRPFVVIATALEPRGLGSRARR